MNLSGPTKCFTFLATGVLMILVLAGCKEDKCEDAICAPCPSSRLVMTYQDSTGACPNAFDASARIHAISIANSADTVYSYNFADSCKAGFLVQEDVEYHLVANGYSEVIRVEDYSFQDPVEVTECCLCYPVDSVMLNIDGNTQTIVFPAGEYENSPLVRVIN